MTHHQATEEIIALHEAGKKLRARIAELEQALASSQTASQHWYDKLQANLTAGTARIERLEAALRFVRPAIEDLVIDGHHSRNCPCFDGAEISRCNCGCGEKLRRIDAALAPQEES